MTLTKYNLVTLRTAFEAITGAYLSTQPGKPNGRSRRDRADKYVLRTPSGMIIHVPVDDVIETEVHPWPHG